MDMQGVLDAIDSAIANETDRISVEIDGVELELSHLSKPYFPRGKPGARVKGDLVRYCVNMSPWILPHFKDRPVVLTRYPGGAGTPGFYVQRAPDARPRWVKTCTAMIKPPNRIVHLRIENTATLIWLANLGAIELHPWYTRCSAPKKPDYLVIDLDPVEGVRFEKVRKAAFAVKAALDAWSVPAFVKTSGGTGLHLFVPIERGPVQRDVLAIAREMCVAIAAKHPKLFTTEYRVANRPRGTVLLDFNQNSPGHTLAGAYCARPTPSATVSMPLEWDDLANGAVPKDFTLATVPSLATKREDPWDIRKLEGKRMDLVAWRRANGARDLVGALPR